MISIIVATDNKFGFGKDGKIPWHYPEDFKFFKETTKEKTLIMGRKTFDDLLTYSKNGKPLPDRKLVVVTSKPLPLLSNVYKANNTTEALEVAHTFCKDIFFIGGEQIFKAGLQVADSVYLTYINKDFECDRFFDKDLLESNFDLIQSKKSEVNKELTFRIYYKNGA